MYIKRDAKEEYLLDAVDSAYKAWRSAYESGLTTGPMFGCTRFKPAMERT